MSGELLVEHQAGAQVLTLSNPQMRNALSPEIYVALLEQVRLAEEDARVRAIVLTGANGCFCAGGNLHRLRENRSKPPAVQSASIERLHEVVRALEACSKPLIAAVEGAAAGAGFSLALACDMIIAAQSAQFVMAYVKVGLSPDGGATWQLSRSLPRQTVAQMLLAGEAWSSERLLSLGVVNEVCADGAALAAALAWCQRLAARSPNAIAAIKGLRTSATKHTLDEQLDAERDSFVACLHHPEAGEAITAFLERRSAKSD